MIKMTLYPKTTRYSENEKGYVLTEKLDGSNLGIGRIGEQIYICQRNYVFTLEEIIDGTKLEYKGLRNWLVEHEQELKELIYDGSIMFGEWLGMGKISYLHLDKFKNKFYVFAKGRIKLDNDKLELSNLVYDLSLLHYIFTTQEFPEFISRVPLVDKLKDISIENLDIVYNNYIDKENRKVEGFVIYDIRSKVIKKYVRYNRNGQLVPHKETGGK
mgnify:CR=1 FL=1|jgi:hypothetical protein